MTTEYARVVVGDKISPLSGGDDDDDEPLLPSAPPSASRNYTTTQRPNVVVYGTQSGVPYAHVPPPQYPPQRYPPYYSPYPAAPGYYGAHPPPPPPPPPGWLILEGEPGEECAFFGCLFSWIPFIGIITFIANFDAPPHTRRGFWARWAMIISSLMILAVIILGPWFYVW